MRDQYFIYSDVGTLGLLHADVVIVPLAQEIKRGACTAAGTLRAKIASVPTVRFHMPLTVR